MSTSDPYATPSGDQPYGPPGGTPPAGYGQGGVPGGYGQGGYGGGGPVARPRNGLGVAALVLGILALLTAITVVGGLLFGLLAVVLGALGRGRAKRGEATNGGLAVAGIVLGVLGIVGAGLLIALGASLLNSEEGQQLRDCLEQAQGDQAAVEQCRLQFEESATR